MWLKKWLGIAERANFMDTRQADEPVTKFLHCLKNAYWYCEFEKHREENQTTKEELIQLRLIDRLHNATYHYEMLEQLQLGSMSLSIYIEFIQQQELIQKFNKSENRLDYIEVADVLKKTITKCRLMTRRKRNVLNLEKNVKIVKKWNIFKWCVDLKRKKVERIKQKKTKQIFEFFVERIKNQKCLIKNLYKWCIIGHANGCQQLKENVTTLLLWGTKLPIHFFTISSSKTMEVGWKRPGTCSSWWKEMDVPNSSSEKIRWRLIHMRWL